MKRVILLAQLAFAAGLTLFAPGAAQGQTSYRIQRIVEPGDRIGDVVLTKIDGNFGIGTLNDSGRLVFLVAPAAGPGEILVEYANSKRTPIVASGKTAPIPGGSWPSAVFVTGPVSMNQLGNIVFAAGDAAKPVGGAPAWETFLWDAKARQVVPVALKGMPAANNLTFETGGEYTPAINNSNEIAFPARIRNGAGEIRSGVFFLGRDGKTLPVALPDQALPDGGKIGDAFVSSINDGGAIGLVVARQGDQGHSGYVWEKGTITSVGRWKRRPRTGRRSPMYGASG